MNDTLIKEIWRNIGIKNMYNTCHITVQFSDLNKSFMLHKRELRKIHLHLNRINQESGIKTKTSQKDFSHYKLKNNTLYWKANALSL